MLKFLKPIVLAGVVVLGASFHFIQAEEYGRGHYTPGEEGSFTGVLPEAGSTKFDLKFYSNNGQVEDSKQLPFGQSVGVNVQGYRSITYLNFTHVSEAKIAGGELGFDIRFPLVYQETSANIVKSGFFTVNQQPRYSNNFGIGDIVITPLMLGWHHDSSHFKLGVSVFTPTGEFDKSSIANTGLNYWTYTPFLAYTHVVPGRNEISFNTGVDFNTKNTETEYQTGAQFHLDYLAAHFFKSGMSLGVAGTVYQQIEDDSGDGAVLGGMRAQAYGLGPVFRYTGRHPDSRTIFEVKWIPEYDVKNRPEGDPLWFNWGWTF